MWWVAIDRISHRIYHEENTLFWWYNMGKLPELFDRMIEIYVKCVRHTLALYLSEEWAEKDGGWYAYFLKLDAKNTANSPVQTEDITAHVSGVEEFDFQACNKTLQYLTEARDVIYDKADVSKKMRSCINPYFAELIRIRNKYIGHENYTEEQLKMQAEDRDRAVEMMHRILQNAFRAVIDPDSPDKDTFFSVFETVRLQYINQHKVKAYYLSDHLDLKKYDASRFFAVCKKLGIDTDIEDDRYIFYTYDLNGTVALLRNFLAKGGDGRDRAPVAGEAASKKGMTGKKLMVWMVVALVGVALIGLLISAMAGRQKHKTPGGTDTTTQPAVSGGSGGALTVDISDLLGELQGSDKTTAGTKAPDGVLGSANEIPAEYAGMVQAFKYENEQRINLMTLTVKVGGYATPQEATTWGQGTIYSENNTVAVGEGILVKGVSPGETYITYVHNSLCTVYRVIVTP